MQKCLMEAIKKRYGGNKESKKVQRTLLKQQYENFAGLSSKTMDQTFDRLKKLINQLEIQGEVITQEDMNLKLFRSLPSEWKTHASIWRNKQEIKTINNTAYGVSAVHTQSNPTSGDNLSDAVIFTFLASQPNSPQFSHELDLIGLNWSATIVINMVTLQENVELLEIRKTWEERLIEEYDVETSPYEMALGMLKQEKRYIGAYQAEEEHPTNFALMAHTSSGSSYQFRF
ncbi:hypothetical protein Tco_0038956 [Tanacetum coccineum]